MTPVASLSPANNLSPARAMIASPNGRSGKTVISLGLLRSLKRQGTVVQPFKKGPDFIDPAWHKLSCGRVSRNLDSVFMSSVQIRSLLLQASHTCDLSIIEAAMGLFDGMDLRGSSSSAEIARITDTPVILVLDTTRMTRTAAALVLGCQHFDPHIRIAAVILNKVRGNRHEQVTRKSIEDSCGIPVIGAIPNDSRLVIPEYHPALLSTEDACFWERRLDEVADIIAASVDLNAFVAIAHEAAAVFDEDTQGLDADGSQSPDTMEASVCCPGQHSAAPAALGKPSLRIAVIRDQSFCFYYEENLLSLQEQGAELVFVNSLVDNALPSNIHALYVGGGYPELFAAQLQDNESFRSSVRERVEAGLPVFAEAGGLAFLGRSLTLSESEPKEGATYEMVGSLQLDTLMQQQRQAHGYTRLKATGALPWLELGCELAGHEHHRYKVLNPDPSLPFAFTNSRGRGIDGQHDGICYRGVVATCSYVNALASPLWAKKFTEQARAYKEGRLKEW